MNADTFVQSGLMEGYIHETDISESLTIEGHSSSYRVYEIRLDHLHYNIKNGRIATFVTRYKQEHEGYLPPADSAELGDLIEGYIEDINPQRLRKTKVDIENKGQQRAAIVLSDGTVIDGNRRFTCLRKIQKEKDQAQYLRCIVIDSSLDDQTLKGLELEIQFGQDEKVPYDPVARLVDIYEWCRVGDMDPEFYRGKCNMTSKEMEAFLGQVDLMVDFLDFIDAPGQFHIVQDLKLQGPLESLNLGLKKCHDEDMKEDLKVAVFGNLLTKNEGDITRHVRKMCDVAMSSEGEDYLEEQVEIATEILEKFEDLPEDKDVDVPFIREKIRSDRDLIDKQTASFERAKTQMNNVKIKGNQLKEIQRASNNLEAVEVDLLDKLSRDTLTQMKLSLGSISQRAADLTSAVDSALLANDEN